MVIGVGWYFLLFDLWASIECAYLLGHTFGVDGVMVSFVCVELGRGGRLCMVCGCEYGDPSSSHGPEWY